MFCYFQYVQAYFTDGQQPDTDTLVAIASSHSMNVDDVKSYITDEDVLMKIHQTASDWSDKGVTGRYTCINVYVDW